MGKAFMWAIISFNFKKWKEVVVKAWKEQQLLGINIKLNGRSFNIEFHKLININIGRIFFLIFFFFTKSLKQLFFFLGERFKGFIKQKLVIIGYEYIIKQPLDRWLPFYYIILESYNNTISHSNSMCLLYNLTKLLICDPKKKRDKKIRIKYKKNRKH